MDALTAIFGTNTKVKILRLFLFNPEGSFFAPEIAARTQIPLATVKMELAPMIKADFLRKRLITKEVPSPRGPQYAPRKLRGFGYALNQKFPYLEPLKNLLTVSSISADESLAKKFHAVGKLKLAVAAGVFIQNWDSRVDLLLVGDDFDLAKLEKVIRNIEAEIGKELAYSAFETADFEYRLGIHDRLIRDILDYPHVTILDRLGVDPR